MTFDLSQSADLLARTPQVLDDLLRGTSPDLHRADEGPDTWSPSVVVGHLVHGEETDWIPRARLILQAAERGASPPHFEPYDRFAQFERFGSWTLDRLLDRFAELRRDNLATLAEWNLTDAHLALAGEHPELGPVTLENLLAAWVVHDLGHIVQVSRVMANTYKGEIGPWPEYLTVLGQERILRHCEETGRGQLRLELVGDRTTRCDTSAHLPFPLGGAPVTAFSTS